VKTDAEKKITKKEAKRTEAIKKKKTKVEGREDENKEKKIRSK